MAPTLAAVPPLEVVERDDGRDADDEKEDVDQGDRLQIALVDVSNDARLPHQFDDGNHQEQWRFLSP